MTTTQIDVEAFRLEARAWLQANLEPRAGERKSGPAQRNPVTPAQLAKARVLQRKLFDAGFAGISYPVEYGGRGLTVLHERAFREESLAYVAPDFGVVGAVTFGAIGRSLLSHCPPEFLQRHIPKILSGRSCGASSTPSPRRVRTSPASVAVLSVTGTAGSSAAPRSGAAARTSPIGRCAWPAPTGACPSTAA